MWLLKEVLVHQECESCGGSRDASDAFKGCVVVSMADTWWDSPFPETEMHQRADKHIIAYRMTHIVCITQVLKELMHF